MNDLIPSGIPVERPHVHRQSKTLLGARRVCITYQDTDPHHTKRSDTRAMISSVAWQKKCSVIGCKRKHLCKLMTYEVDFERKRNWASPIKVPLWNKTLFIYLLKSVLLKHPHRHFVSSLKKHSPQLQIVVLTGENNLACKNSNDSLASF